MKNIVNEFLQYHSKLDKKLDSAKLLAMIIYKNYHPKDFSLLHNQEGLVYKIIANKIKLPNNPAVEERDKKIKEINDEIKELAKISELRNGYCIAVKIHIEIHRIITII